MNNIEETINKLKQDDLESFRLKIFDLNKSEDVQSIEKLIKNKKISSVIDDFKKQQHELWFVENPESLLRKKEYEESPEDNSGVWIYYSWHRKLVHCLDENSYNVLRLSRNRELINKDEQKEFSDLRIGFAGLNVGNPIAVCIALEGGGSKLMKLADNDTLDFSNLNRFRAGVCDLGLNKAILTARQIYEINPFANLEVYQEGIKESEIEDFFVEPEIDILVEEMDNLDLKVKIREEAKKRRIPVVMITGNGEDAIIDIERFDLDKNLPILNGHLKEEVIGRINEGPKSLQDKVDISRDFIGKHLLLQRMNESFDLVGKELVGIPQIAEASFMRGAVICNAIRKLKSENIKSGRYFIRLSDLFK